ncbi:MAG: hypothetical protein EOP86_03795, partial [Verrucomicrobiaceae bacterium]
MGAEIAEALFYDRDLTPAERSALDTYLIQRYNLPRAAEPPVITPDGGSFANQAQVTLTSPLAGASIRYTLDGNEPTAASTLYSGPFTLTASATVKAKVFASGVTASDTASAGFSILGGGDVPHNGLLLWLRADTGISQDAGAITGWADQSGQG